jgi:hypothetical protein
MHGYVNNIILKNNREWCFGSPVHMLPLFESNSWHILKCQKIQTKNLQVRALHMLCVYKVISRKIDLPFGLRKNDKFWCYKQEILWYMFCLFTLITCNIVFSRNFTNTYELWRCICEIFHLNFLTLRNIFFLHRKHMHMGAELNFWLTLTYLS